MRYIATGRVHPERAQIMISPIEWQIPDDGRVVVQSDSSQISICLELNSIDGWITAKLVAEHYAMIVVGVLGFSLGSGYSVEIIQVTEEDGTPHVFGVRPEGDVPNQTLQTLGFEPYMPIFNRAFELANQDVFFRLALRDFLRGINDAVDCATYCYRAIESIKASFVFSTGKDRWDDMHAELSTNKDEIKTIVKDYADPVRHGNWAEAKITDLYIRWKMLLLTRQILVKYLDYKIPTIP
jgi:hypothetical protein